MSQNQKIAERLEYLRRELRAERISYGELERGMVMSPQLPDGKPGHYYVTVRSHGGKVAYAAGPFTQTRPGTLAHRQALGAVKHVKRIVERTFRSGDTAFAEYGTARVPLNLRPPVCVLDKHRIAWKGAA